MHILLHHVPAVRDQKRPVLEQLEIALRADASHIRRKRKHIASLLQRAVCRDQRAALQRSLHHQHAESQTAENPVSDRKMLAQRGRSGRILA